MLDASYLLAVHDGFYHPSKQADTAKSIPYFDLDKNEWRSFDIRNFIGFVEPVDQPTGTPVDR